MTQILSKWDSSPHPISDVRDWRSANKLEIQPDFQRREVWSEHARVMLIDTILKGIPMPKMFVAKHIKEGSTHRVVIDGQQRIRAILDFLDDKFPLTEPYSGDYYGQYFSSLEETIRNLILSYRIDFNEASDLSDADIREAYSRVNKYTVALNKQELRRADYPGDFLDISETLALDELLDEFGVFTSANRRRMGDVEYTSELLSALISGPQDKKIELDKFYYEYRNWVPEEKNKIILRFKDILTDIKTIFLDFKKPFNKTRFRQKADFYSLFVSISNLQKEGFSLNNKPLEYLKEDLFLLDNSIEPNSPIRVFSEYAIRCLSDANSKNSRKWRIKFIQLILSGTYKEDPINTDFIKLYGNMIIDLYNDSDDPMCPASLLTCVGGNNKVPYYEILKEQFGLVWANDAPCQINNASFVCGKHISSLENTKSHKVAIYNETELSDAFPDLRNHEYKNNNDDSVID